jgi:16S rRNA (uracil1498-N3)-methyltransferase
MPSTRFYLCSRLQAGQEVILEGNEFHHLAHVMRLEEGEQAEFVNGAGTLAIGVLKQREKKQATFIIESFIQQEKTSSELILAQGLPRLNRLDFIIEKSTELGATQIWLFPGQNSERKSLNEHQLKRMESLMIAAMKQCGRLYLPSLVIKPALHQWDLLKIPAFFGDVRETAPFFWHIHSPGKEALFFIGPEAGFTAAEIERLGQMGAQGVKLHPNILRTDTAALVALSIMSQ